MNLFVIGKPIKHSMSPTIHNFWLKKYSKPYIYTKKELDYQSLSNVIDEIKQKKIIGANVTIPYKKDVYDILENLHISARRSKAVNTIYRQGDTVYGANTDGIGYCEALKQETQLEIKDKNILILGSGGASYGILSELIERRAASITISNRTEEKSFELIKNFEKSTTVFKYMKWNKIIPVAETDLIINTTSFGMNEGETIKIEMKDLKDSTIYSDIIYKPKITPTMKIFKEKGFTTQNGLGMLINQAAEAFRLWFNINLTNQDIIEAKELCEKSY